MNTLQSPGLRPTLNETNIFGGSTTLGKTNGNLLGGEIQVSVKVDKENALPQELLSCVSAFESFMKYEKNHSSQVAKASLQPIRKVSDDTEVLKHILTKVESGVVRNNNSTKKIMSDTIRDLSDCELAQSAEELCGLFPKNFGVPYEYFCNLCERFQENLISIQLQLESAEKYMSCVLNPTAFTPQQLSILLQRAHESFVALAGRMQSLHTRLLFLKQKIASLKQNGITYTSEEPGHLRRF